MQVMQQREMTRYREEQKKALGDYGMKLEQQDSTRIE